METTKDKHIYSVRNTEDGQTVSLEGDGEFCIGLTLDERIACTRKQNSKGATGDNDIVVPLVVLTVWRTSGVTVSPASRDLKCHLNGEDIGMEAHIIPGDRIEVGDKVLELMDETVARTPRRHLPPTPGVPILPTPPPKPQRSIDSALSATLNCESEAQPKDAGWGALREWCLIELPNSENELLQKAKDPDQLANLAAGYLTRHINVHTDVVVSIELTDRIFKMMQEVAHHRKDILRRFLSEVITEVIVEENSCRDESHHATVTALLVEILRQFLDPGYLVLLCLTLLRALSHIPGNVVTMVANQTTAAVLGSMAAYKDDESVQNNCLDILAKMATFKPAVLEKPPMRESSIDLVTMAMTLHSKNLTIVQAGIRTLANLASSLHSLAFAAMAESPHADLRAYVSLVITVLEYLYNNTLPLIREALGVFCNDLNVKMDGRRYLFEYAKMDQLKRQQKLWELAPDVPIRTASSKDHTYRNQTIESAESGEYANDISDEHENTRDDDSDSESKIGILKKSRSFENLRNPERRVSFVNEDDLVSSLSSSSSASPPVCETEQVDREDSPDIQILSRSRIYPTRLSTEDSTDSEVISSPQQNRDTPSSPVKPPRRAIGAPLTNLGSQSDSEIDSILDSPCDKDGNKNSNTKPQNLFNSDPDKVQISDLHITSNSATNGPVSTSPDSLVNNSSGFSTQSSQSQQHTPVDLTDFRYSAADVVFMKRLMSIQVTCHVCSGAVRGRDPPALKLIDMPLLELLSRPGIPNAVWQFADSQFEENSTLMDIDPATVISVIDAVRYKILAFDLVRKSLQLLIQNLSSKLHQKMFQVTGEVIQSVVRDTALSPIVADKEFISSFEQELHSVKKNLRDPRPMTILMDNMSFLLKSSVKEQEN